MDNKKYKVLVVGSLYEMLVFNLIFNLGMAGKVLIVNGSGGKQQALTINPSSGQTVVSLPGQNPLQSKPFLLLPNNGKVTSHIQPQPQIVNPNAMHMIVTPQNNPAIQQLRPAPGAIINQQLTAPVSLSNFQNIRPKTTPQSIRALQPVPSQGANKVVITQPKSMYTSTQLGATKTIPMQTLLQGSQANSFQVRPALSTKPLQQLQKPIQFSSVPNANSITKVGSKIPKNVQSSSVSIVKSAPNTSTSNALQTTFDKTMSQHLLELEKTDPHLFKGSKLTIAQSAKTPKSTQQQQQQQQQSSSLATQQEKIKLYLQQQQQQLKRSAAAAVANAKINQTKITTQQQQQPTTPKSATVASRPAPHKIASSMPQLLSNIHQQQPQTSTQQQQQQTSLQELLIKQKLLQQQQQSTAIKQQQSHPQPSQLQQQQLVTQLLAAAASGGQLNMQQKQAQQAVEMYLLQQKLLQVGYI